MTEAIVSSISKLVRQNRRKKDSTLIEESKSEENPNSCSTQCVIELSSCAL